VEKLKTTTLIGADGTFSHVARIADRNGHETTPILQAIVKLADGARPKTTQVWFEPGGYALLLLAESRVAEAGGGGHHRRGR